jgi:hypothetical protein
MPSSSHNAIIEKKEVKYDSNWEIDTYLDHKKNKWPTKYSWHYIEETHSFFRWVVSTGNRFEVFTGKNRTSYRVKNILFDEKVSSTR